MAIPRSAVQTARSARTGTRMANSTAAIPLLSFEIALQADHECRLEFASVFSLAIPPHSTNVVLRPSGLVPKPVQFTVKSELPVKVIVSPMTLVQFVEVLAPPAHCTSPFGR